MKEHTLKILACPMCRSHPLEMLQSKSHIGTDGLCEVFQGLIICRKCGNKYPLIDGIPHMMPGDVETGTAAEVVEANVRYHDLRANVYDQEEENCFVRDNFVQSRIEGIIGELAQKSGSNREYFLDVGCGTGNLLKYGHKYFRHAVGADVSTNMLRQARAKGLEVVRAEAIHLPFKEKVFNVVSIFSVLHHLYDYRPFFEEASRVLKSGGFLYTDWDPLKPPQIDTNRISWRTFQILKFIAKPIKELARRGRKQELVNVRELEPDIKKMAEIAEYHNIALKGQDRGIDYDEIQNCLSKNSFVNVKTSFHCAGRTKEQFRFAERIKFFFFRFQDYPVERFAENIMVIAQRSNNESK